MQVKDLVKLKNNLASKIPELHAQDSFARINHEFNNVIADNPAIDGAIINPIRDLQEKFDSLLNEQIAVLTASIDQIIEIVNNEIDRIADPCIMKPNYRYDSAYGTSWYNEYFAEANNRNLHSYMLDPKIDDVLIARLRHYTDWHYPALQFGLRYCGQLPTVGPTVLSEFTSKLVTAEPLYLADFSRDIIDRAISQFHPDYQRKLCTYVINDDFSILPQEQFSLVHCWGLLNYAEMDVIKKYLTSFFDLLRAGGTVMFSYNNCDYLEGIELAEQGQQSYAPKRHILAMLKEIGYEILQTYDLDNIDPMVKKISWIEARKPGELTSVKAHSVLGAVYPRH
jgi:hypothetical protein